MKRFTLVASTLFAMTVSAWSPTAAQVFDQHNLVSDDTTLIPAALADPDLKNAWGLAAGPATFWWSANNGTGTSTLYNGTGAKQALTVTVPGDPTGVVFNGSPGFVVNDGHGHSGPALFIFDSEDGTISGWNPAVPPPPFSTQAFVAVDNSASGAVYKGLALAANQLYATNFHAGTVEVFDSNFAPVPLPGAFMDPHLPAGYAPFGIANINGVLFVTYALQDADKHDDVRGPGHGFVDAYDTAGHLLRRVASKGQLNSPWGVVLAPNTPTLGKYANNVLIGNFGDGRIHAFKSTNHGEYHRHGPLRGTSGRPLMIDGLWALAFGNGNNAGPTDTLFFTSGPFDEAHGLFGSLNAVRPPRHDDGDED